MSHNRVRITIYCPYYKEGNNGPEYAVIPLGSGIDTGRVVSNTGSFKKFMDELKNNLKDILRREWTNICDNPSVTEEEALTRMVDLNGIITCIPVMVDLWITPNNGIFDVEFVENQYFKFEVPSEPVTFDVKFGQIAAISKNFRIRV